MFVDSSISEEIQRVFTSRYYRLPAKVVGANAHINPIAFMELVSVRIEAKREGFDHYLGASAGLVI